MSLPDPIFAINPFPSQSVQKNSQPGTSTNSSSVPSINLSDMQLSLSPTPLQIIPELSLTGAPASSSASQQKSDSNTSKETVKFLPKFSPTIVFEMISQENSTSHSQTSGPKPFELVVPPIRVDPNAINLSLTGGFNLMAGGAPPTFQTVPENTPCFTKFTEPVKPVAGVAGLQNNTQQFCAPYLEGLDKDSSANESEGQKASGGDKVGLDSNQEDTKNTSGATNDLVKTSSGTSSAEVAATPGHHGLQLGILKKTKSEGLALFRARSSTLNNACLLGPYFNPPSQRVNQELASENDHLRKILALKQTRLELLDQFIRQNFKSQEMLPQELRAETLQALSLCFQDKPLVQLCYAVPLVSFVSQNCEAEDGESHQPKYQEMQQLDFNKEFRGAIEGMRETGSAIQVKRVRATWENFTKALTDNPVGLHVSCHGVERPTHAQMGRQAPLRQSEGNCLVFETEDGIAHYVSEARLKDLLEVTCKLRFVFIASCHSRFAGDIFHAAGAEHVICVRQRDEILDEAAVIFSRTFYALILKQTLTVCGAFERAKQTLRGNPDQRFAAEAEKFILIKQKGHKCPVLGPFPQGQVEQVNQAPTFAFKVARVDEFVGRQCEMQVILESVHNNRLITVVGLPGIGKTTICKQVGFYIAEREVFRDGIVYFTMRGADLTSRLIQMMYLDFSIHTSGVQRLESAISLTSTEAKLQLDYQSMAEKIYELLHGRQLLLCIDNIEDCHRKDGEQLREFLGNLLEKVPDLKVLTTSRDQLGNIGEITEKVFRLPELNNSFTVELLEKKSLREITNEEVTELLQYRPDTTKRLFEVPCDARATARSLEDHHLCTLLGGHPHAISLVAPLLQNRKLVELYQLLRKMMDSRNFISDMHALNPIDSLKVSLDASVQHVRKQSEAAIELFCLLGLLPGGVTEPQLSELWAGADWLVLAEMLRKASLLMERLETHNFATRGEKKFTLLPFMNKYAESLLNMVQLQTMHRRCLDFFQLVLDKLYGEVCVESYRHEQAVLRLVFLDHETNIWNCLYRVCDLHGIGTSHDSQYTSKLKMHAHHISGYTSADDYEAVLISDLNTENEDEIVPRHFATKMSKRSVGIADQDADDPGSQPSEEAAAVGSGVAQSSAGQTTEQDQESILATLSSQKQWSEHQSKRKSVRFNETSHDDRETARKNLYSLSALKYKATHALSAGQISYGDRRPDLKETLSQVQEEVYYSDLSCLTSDSQDSAMGSITKSGFNDTDSLVQPASKTLQRNKTEGNLHSPTEHLDFIVRQTSDQSAKPIPGKLSAWQARPRSRSREIIFKSVSSAEKFGSDAASRQRSNSQTNISKEAMSGHNPSRRDALTTKTLGATTSEFPCSSHRPVSSNATTHERYNSSANTAPPSKTAPTSAPAREKRPINENPMLLNRTFKQKRPQRKPKVKTETTLEPIQEKQFCLTADGTFVVSLVAVLILNGKYTDAMRAIKLIHEFKFSDSLCLANLTKLQGLVLLLQKKEKTKDALKCFEIAEKQFSKRSQSQNLGVAQCAFAQGELLFQRHWVFSKDQPEAKVFKRAEKKFDEARQIYKDANHLAGAAQCSKQLGNVKRKLGLPNQKLFKESIELQKSMKKDQCIPRYSGWQTTLLIQTVDQAQLGLLGTGTGVQKTDQRAPPLLAVKESSKRPKEFTSQTRVEASSDKKDIPTLNVKSIKALDVLSSEDEHQMTQISTQKDPKMDTIQEWAPQNSKASQIKVVANLGIEKARQRREAAREKRIQEELALAQRNAISKNAKQSKKKMLSIPSTPSSLHQQKSTASAITAPSVIEATPLPLDIQNKAQLDYSWAYAIQIGDLNWKRRADQSLPWVFYDFDQNYQIEQFFNCFVNPDLRSRNSDSLEQKLLISGKFGYQSNNAKYYIQKKNLTTLLKVPLDKHLQSPIGMNQHSLDLIQVNAKTGYSRQIVRFDRVCQNTQFSLMQELVGLDLTEDSFIDQFQASLVKVSVSNGAQDLQRLAGRFLESDGNMASEWVKNISKLNIQQKRVVFSLMQDQIKQKSLAPANANSADTNSIEFLGYPDLDGSSTAGTPRKLSAQSVEDELTQTQTPQRSMNSSDSRCYSMPFEMKYPELEPEQLIDNNYFAPSSSQAVSNQAGVVSFSDVLIQENNQFTNDSGTPRKKAQIISGVNSFKNSLVSKLSSLQNNYFKKNEFDTESAQTFDTPRSSVSRLSLQEMTPRKSKQTQQQSSKKPILNNFINNLVKQPVIPPATPTQTLQAFNFNMEEQKEGADATGRQSLRLQRPSVKYSNVQSKVSQYIGGNMSASHIKQGGKGAANSQVTSVTEPPLKQSTAKDPKKNPFA